MNDYNPSNDELEQAVVSTEMEASLFKQAFISGDKKAAVFAVAKHLIVQHHPKTIGGRNREVLTYRDGIYVPGEDILKAEVQILLEESCTVHYIKEIIEAVKNLTIIDRADLKVETRFINLNNGVLNIETNTLMEHSPEFLFLNKIPADYAPEADCPAIKKYLSEVLDEAQIKIVQEWFGYSLYREYSFKKALICVGEGDTGKTTLINLFHAFLGEDNIAGVSLQKISSDKFSASHLYGKHINLYDDLSVRDINDNGAFKIATGGGIITGEKKFGDQFQFKNYAKLTFACNKIPDVKDANDEAYFKRWIVLQFNRAVEEGKQDRQLIHKMTTVTELSGLLNFALEGLQRLLQQQKFSYDKDAGGIKAEMLRSGSVVARFGYECLEEATGEWVKKDDMYSAFTRYTSENHLPAVSSKEFCSRLPVCFPHISDFRPKSKLSSKQVYAWQNVRLKDGGDDPPMSEEEELEKILSEADSEDIHDY